MYTDPVKYFEAQPQDVCTVPLTGKQPLWFYVFVRDNRIYIDRAREHSPSSSVSKIRYLCEKEYGNLFDLYHRRINGEAISREAAGITRNQVYRYGIFAAMGL